MTNAIEESGETIAAISSLRAFWTSPIAMEAPKKKSLHIHQKPRAAVWMVFERRAEHAAK